MSPSSLPLIEKEIDRLIDGEMSLTEQRALLASLGGDVELWRRLALGFVESQVLRKTCRDYLSEVQHLPPKQSYPSGTMHPKWRMRFFRGVTMTAAVVIAFWLGAVLNRPAQTPDMAPASTVFHLSDATALDSVKRLQVVFPEGPGRWSTAVELPVVDSSDQLAQVWLSGQPVWPRSLQEALEDLGRNVSEQRHWLEVELEDGRLGYVPISELVVTATERLQYP